MFPQPAPADYFDRANPAILRAVPEGAVRLLDVGCGGGALGREFKRDRPDRIAFGIERDPAAAARARTHLDSVWELDLEATGVFPCCEPGFDCISFGDVLEHTVDPESVLRRVRPLLAPGGIVLASLPNVGHASVLRNLFRGEFPYVSAGLLDSTHLRFFTRAGWIELFLDAGYAPGIVAETSVGDDPGFLAAATPLLNYLRVPTEYARRNFGVYQYLLRAQALDWGSPPRPVEPFSVVCCVSDEEILSENLLRSPDLAAGHPHELLLARRCRSAAEGLNWGLGRAQHRRVVCLHQDVYLPQGWFGRFQTEWDRAEATSAAVALVGLYGIARRGGAPQRAGRVVDRGRWLAEAPPLPIEVESLDELLIGVRRDSGLRFESSLGFHLYGTEIAAQARSRGLGTVVVEAPVFHNSRSLGLGPDFAASVRRLAQLRPAELPIWTPCAEIRGPEHWSEW